VTLDVATGVVLDPGRDLVGDDAALAAVDQAVALRRGYGYLRSGFLGDELSRTDKWIDAMPSDVQSCRWGDETVVVVAVPHAIGGWLPVAVRDGQARLMNWDELTG